MDVTDLSDDRHDRLPNPTEVAQALSSLVEGDVNAEEWYRHMYATDASPYEIVPLCVVLPRSPKDVIATVRFARSRSIPVTGRGGGSGLVGGALGRGIIIDFSRYMNHLVSVEGERVTCEPGIYKRNLDHEVMSRTGRVMPADPSPEPYCTLGGMIGTNASGAHSLKYGHTIDYLEEVDLVLASGSLVTLGPVELGSPEWAQIRELGDTTERSRIYNRLYDLVAPRVDQIVDSMPKVSKNSAGYRLDALIRREGQEKERVVFNPAKVVCGSEGTLGVVVRSTFRTVQKPPKKGLLILRYDTLEAMGRAIPTLTKEGPSAVELMDRNVIDSASILDPAVKDLSKGKLLVVIVEFEGESGEEVEAKLRDLQGKAARENSNESNLIVEEAEVERIWSMREEALGFAYKVKKGTRRTECVIEDTVVPPIHLGKYLGELDRVCQDLGLEWMSWGHVSEGNIHMRPFLDYKDEADLAKAKRLADEVYSLVASYRGTSTGEHSDGILRAPYLQLIYDEAMVSLFASVKRLFDEGSLMNPEKKTDSLGLSPLRDLRYGAGYRAKAPSGADANWLNWGNANSRVMRQITGRDAELSFEEEVESCFGCGKCRELSNTSRMCPVFDAEREEVSACRGRNNIVRWMNRLGATANGFSATREYGDIIYKNCIQCKMCVVDCPADTNVGKLMAEARAKYTREMGVPRGYNFFFDIDRYARLGCRLAPLSNVLMRNPAFRALTEVAAGIDRKKTFPPFRRRKFVDLFEERRRERRKLLTPPGAATSERNSEDRVVFFYDTYINYNDPGLGIRIVRLLEEGNDVQVFVPEQMSSGLPALLEGDPDRGRKNVRFNVEHLAPYASAGVPIVTFSPSAGLALKNDYLDVYDTPESRLVSENTLDIHEYIVRLEKSGRLRKERMRPLDTRCLLHMHCHTIVQQADDSVRRALHLIPSLSFEELNNGCCGNGGSYSFIKGNLERSFRMARRLTDDIHRSKLPVYTTGESCKIQLEQSTGGVHLGLTSELLADTFSV